MNKKTWIALMLVFVMMIGSVMVPLMTQTSASHNSLKPIPDSSLSSNTTLLYEFQVNNTGPAFTNGYFPLTFTNESLFLFNTTGNVVQNVNFLYSNGSHVRVFIPTGQPGLPNTDQGSGKWEVYLTNVSMPALSSMDIYMEVFPSTTSDINANYSTTTSANIGYASVDMANTSQVWVKAGYTGTLTRTATSLVISGGVSSTGTQTPLQFVVNYTFNSGIYFLAGWNTAGSGGYSSNGYYSLFGTPLAGVGYYTDGGIFYWGIQNLTGKYISTYGRGAYSPALNIMTYEHGDLNYSIPSLVAQSVNIGSVDQWNGSLANFASTSSVIFEDLSTSTLSQSGITQKSLGTVTSITPQVANSGKYILFNETGLPYGQSWNVSIKNGSANVNQLYTSTTNNLKAFLPTGYNFSYAFSTFDASYYNITNLTGSVELLPSSNATVNISLTNVSYYVHFLETGLTSGSSWSVTLNGSKVSSTSTEINYILRNGTYSWVIGVSSVYTVNVSSGSVIVSGNAMTEYIGFTYTAFNITFSETGLPANQVWSLTIANVTYNSVNGIVLFQGKAGSYSAKINNASYYTPVNAYFNFTVSGNAQYTIDYAVLVTFIESGYTGTWQVNVNGVEYSTTTNTIVVAITPGYFSYQITGVSGYTISPITSNTYYYTPQTIKIAFTQTQAPIWSIFMNPEIIAILLIAGVVAGMWIVFKRK
jgi:hypothetical protein